MNFQTRESALQTLRTVTVREIEHRHIVILSYILAMKFDINDTQSSNWSELALSDNITLGPNDITILENVSHLLFEFTTLSVQDVDTIKKLSKDFFRWRLAIASGVICNRIPIYGGLVGTTEVITRLNDFIDPMALNGISQLINRDEDFVNALVSLVEAEAKIVNDMGE